MAESGTVERYVAAFEGASRAAEPGWLASLRRAGIERFAESGFPTTRDEEWKYTNVAPLVQTPFRPVLEPSGDGIRFPGVEALSSGCRVRMVFVNGHFAPGLSDLAALPGGVRVGSLADVVREEPGAVEPWLGRLAGADAGGFAALSTAFIADGAVVRIADGAVAEEPIELLFLAAGTGDGESLAQPRIVVLAGRESRAAIVETWASAARSATLANTVAEVVVGDAASLHHVKVVREGEKGAHVARTHVVQGRDSRYVSASIALAGAFTRNDLSVLLDAPGAACVLDGLYLVAGRAHVDNHTVVDHARPHGTSQELYKGVLDGRGRAVFNGRVLVRADAQKTDARQTNRNLVLSDRAEIDTKPELRILADDVKCSHGAAIGQLDDDAIFYFRSRGVSEETARRLLTVGFAAEIVRRIPFEALRLRLEAAVEAAIGRGGSEQGGRR